MADGGIIMITSFKGGVGKSTVCANLGMALAMRGRRVLLVDCDFRMRCLDLILGMESRMVYDLCDAARGVVGAEKAILPREDVPGLALLGAPYHYRDDLTPGEFAAVLEQAKAAFSADWILLDTPGDPGVEQDECSPFRLAASAAERALIVATHQSPAIRAAEHTGRRLADLGVKTQHLVLNEYRPEGVKRGELPPIMEIIDRSTLQLIGVICRDEAIAALQEKGTLMNALPQKGWKRSNTALAFAHLAARVEGETVGLFDRFRGRCFRNSLR